MDPLELGAALFVRVRTSGIQHMSRFHIEDRRVIRAPQRLHVGRSNELENNMAPPQRDACLLLVAGRPPCLHKL
jgi:hypothetical protein